MDISLPTSLPASKPELYAELSGLLCALIEGERDFIANLANASALLYHALPDINWLGFYLLKDGELVVGPFQGKPACVRIPLGKGVCGTAAARRTTVIVPDVHAFEGHIACDAASNSEIVVPMMRGEELLGVLDVDSPKLNRFDEDDRKGLEAVARLLTPASTA
jgi:L-methionine (R)-S-oxide reductase